MATQPQTRTEVREQVYEILASLFVLIVGFVLLPMLFVGM